ncbi:hypothetical protein [Microbacterium sp. YY-01]|uniref:hypothetical protein n=1 Tax=Microbacterium sp. YY-01 TaxID=3421634 RepID=UPI003D164127
MTRPARPLVNLIAETRKLAADAPVVRWATVTQPSPLRIRMDGDADPMLITPQSLVSGLTVGARVLCVEQHRRMIVVGTRMDIGRSDASGVALSGANDGSAAPVYWDAGVTVTLPTGRFDAPPIVTVTPERSAQVLSANLIARTATSFVVRTIRFGAAVSAGTQLLWHAVPDEGA